MNLNDENDFSKKLCDIIHNLTKQNISKKSISININKHRSIADVQVKYYYSLNTHNNLLFVLLMN